MPEVVVTGASGFIGRAVCAELILRKATVHAVGRIKAPAIPGAQNHGLASYAELPGNARLICVHLAGENRIAQVEQNPQQVLQETLCLADLILNRGFSRTVFISSAAVYGDGFKRPVTEEDVPHPRTAYGEIKLATERVFQKGNGVIVRLANVYGVGMSLENVISEIIKQIPGQEPICVRDTAPVRDYIHLKDVARGIADLALSEVTGIYNLGTGVGTSVLELAQILLKQAGHEARSIGSLSLDSKESMLILDSQKAKQTFGWEAQVSIQEGLKELLG